MVHECTEKVLFFESAYFYGERTHLELLDMTVTKANVSFATLRCATVLQHVYCYMSPAWPCGKDSEGNLDAAFRTSYEYLREFYEKINNVTRNTFFSW